MQSFFFVWIVTVSSEHFLRENAIVVFVTHGGCTNQAECGVPERLVSFPKDLDSDVGTGCIAERLGKKVVVSVALIQVPSVTNAFLRQNIC